MGNRHPLDIFRSSDGGFASASRTRRTLTGKVVATSPRAGGAAAGRAAAPPAILAARGGRPAVAAATGRSSAGPRLAANRVMLYSVLLLVGGLAIYVLGANASATPPLRSETVFTTGDALASTDGYVILAATFRGGEVDYAAAWAARAELDRRGYHAQVLGYRTEDGAGYDRFELIVGHAATPAELEGALGALKSLREWPGIEGAPFTAAQIAPAPKTAS